ncbi:MAG: hypothetical protein V4692_00400 [Bdellovibrionota bacterium]
MIAARTPLKLFVMPERNLPVGWASNPSSLSRRARLSALASISAIMTPFLASHLVVVVGIVAIVAGILALIGNERRWAVAPWLVTLTAFSCLALLVLSFVCIVHERPRLFPLTLSILATIQMGLAFDELLASAQHLRRQDEKRRSFWRAFFGFTPKCRPGETLGSV